MLRSHLALFTIGSLALFIAGSAPGGDKKNVIEIPPVKRGPEHQVLESLVGTFEARVKFYVDPSKPPVDSTGVMTRKMILDGNFLQESYKGSFFTKPFAGLGLVGFDSIKKKYVTTWCDSMSTSILSMVGTYDAEKKTLISVGDDYGADQKKMKARDVLKIISEDVQSFEMYRQPEGAKTEIKIMEITFTRMKPTKK